MLPSDTIAPLSTHWGTPVPQDSLPPWHALAGVQAPPSVHVMQIPSLQTIPTVSSEHRTPFARFPLSVHTGEPVAHTIVPVLHELLG